MAIHNTTRGLNKLTASEVKSAKPRLKPYRLVDGGGLTLTVKPTGARYWQLRYRYAGKENTASIGVYPDVSLKDAREDRTDIRKQIDDGIDPNRHKRTQKALSKHDFESVAREWYAKSKHKWKNEKHSAQVIGTLDKFVFPSIGNIPIADVTTSDVWECIEQVIGKKGRYETASRVLQRVGQVFTYAIILRKELGVKDNPTAGVSTFIVRPPEKRDRHHPALEPKNVPQFLEDYAKSDATEQTRIAMRLLMLTAVRTSELIEAPWSEFDLEARKWIIPASRMKSGRAHVVPLSQQAIDTLSEARKYSRGSDLVFPGRSSLKKPISNNTVLFSIYDAGYKGRMTGHGFRAVFSTYLHALKTKPKDGSDRVRVFNENAVEFQLAHADGNKTKAAYDRNSHIEERTRIMDYWGTVCDNWADDSDNVTPIHRAAS